MTKKSLNKLLSIILTIAICATTVFGCLITANATNVECYTWSDGIVAEDLTSATINLNLLAPTDYLADGIYEAMFSVGSENNALVLEKVEVTDGTRVDGTAFSAEDYSVDYIEANKTVDIFAASIEDNASKLTLTLTFSFADGVATQGAKYYATIANLEMTDGVDGTDGDGHYISYTGAATSGLINAGCDHVYSVSGLTPIQTNTVDGYYVYENVPCSKCSEVNPYQVVPATELKNVIYWDGTTSQPTTTDADGNILITSAAELAWLTNNTVTGNYKIADGIDAIVLQSQAHAEAIMALADVEQTKAYFEANKSALTVWENGGTFQGDFDGNGVEIYGMYSTNTNGGLFSTVKVGENHSTIKNIAVKNSCVIGQNTSSALVGTAVAGYSYTVAEATATGYIEFEKVVLANNYIFNTWLNSIGNRLGVMLANAATYVNVSMNHCLVYGNHIEGYYRRVVPTDSSSAIDTTDTVEGGLFGALSKGHNGEKTLNTEDGTYTYRNGKYSNSIILDCVPYLADQDKLSAYSVATGGDVNNGRANHAFRPDFFSNIYTNCASEFCPVSVAGWYTWSNYSGKIINIDKSDVKGTNAQSIVDTLGGDWQVDEFGGYPKFEGETVSVGGTVLYGRGEPDTVTGGKYSQGNYMTDLVAIKAGTASEEVIAQYGQGTEANPFLIYNSNHLRTIVQYFDASLRGSYFKVADGIDAFVLQTKSEVSLETIMQTPDAQLNTVLKQQWQNGVDTTTWANAVKFSGHIDFNGLTIYGMYSAGGGLIQNAQGDCSFKNLSIKNSYITRNGYVGAIVAQISSIDKTTLGNEGSLTIENCSVEDCYIASTNTSTTGPGIFAGYTEIGYQDVNDVDQDGNKSEYINGAVVIKNCFAKFDSGCYVSGNSVYGGVGLSSGSNNIKVSNCLILGAKPYTNGGDGTGGFQHFINSGNFSNVYTDQSVADGKIGTNAQNYSNGKITQISASSVEGAAAVDTLNGFDFDTVWTYDGNGGYPTPVPQPAINTTSQLNLNLLGANISYNNDGSFNFNFYYEPAIADIVPVLYVGRADGDGFTKLNGTALGADEATALGVAEGTLRYSIENISAREIGDTFLPTAVAKNGISTVYGKTESISVNDYADAIISDSSVDAADKKVAVALVNYGSAATSVFEAANPVITEKRIVYADNGIAQTAPTRGTGSETDPYIIENPSHLRYIAQMSTPDTTYGVYYKVDPTIDILVFQRENYIKGVAGSLEAFMALDAEGTKAALSNTSVTVDGKAHDRIQYQSGTTASGYASFAGTIDFSGVTICGMYNQNGGLIAVVNGGATLKNLTLCNNYIASGWYNGNLAGYIHTGGASTDTYKPVTVSNVVIHDCYQTTTGNGYGQTGVLLGTSQNSNKMPHYISNILTYDNISLGQTSSDNTTMVNCALYGQLPVSWNGESDGVQNASYNNIVTLDCVPYPTQAINNQLTKSQFWSNVYTTQLTEAVPCTQGSTNWADYDITKLSSADLAKGAAAKDNMPGLDWGNIWFANSIGYPTLNQTGVTFEKAGKTIYWDNTKTDSTLADKGEKGTVDNPIIIDSAEELFQLTNVANFSATAGKYYKVADGIDTMVLQPEGKLDLNTLLSCANASEVADYLTGISGISNWNKDSETWFDGHFDGNGVTIIGMYSNARSAGLFPTADGGIPDANKEDNTGITIGNFTLKNSYVLANSGQNRAGAIVGGTPGPNYGNKVDGVINFENIAVENCYVQSAGSSGACGVFLGVQGNEIVRVNNCAVYGTEAYYTSSGALTNAALFNGYNGRKARDEAGNQIDGTFIDNTVSNSIILGIRPYYLWWTERVSNPRCITNVYTDQPLNPYPQATYTEENLIAVTADGLIGDGATSVVNALNNVAGKTLWYVGNNIDGMPGFAKASAVPTVFAAEYNSVQFNNFNDYGESTDNFGLYTTSLNLKNNPYMSLTFAFGNLDGVNTKYDRENIKVTVNGNVLPALPAYEEGVYISDVDGWTNKKGAGRYHMYELDNLNIYDLSEPITVEIEYNGKTITNTISVEGFGLELQRAYTVAPCDYYSTRIEAVKALLFYTQSLSEKYGA